MFCCPACRRPHQDAPGDTAANAAVSATLHDDGSCPRCGRQWPTISAWQRDIAVVHDDPQAANELRTAVAWIERHLAGEASAREQPVDLSDLDADARSWAKAVWTWGPAHLGQYLSPPVPQPDLGWVAAFLGALDDLPPGPVLLLGGAIGGEALALPDGWLGTSATARPVICLDSHPWLLAAGAYASSPGVHLGVLRRPGVVERRPLALPASIRARLQGVQLVLGDAHDPPFAAESFAAIVALNVLDSVHNPWLVMHQCEALLKPSGALLVSSPWHFQPEITVESQRLDRDLPLDGDLPWLIAGRLTGAAIPGVLSGLALQHLERDLPWRLRVHDRLTSEYRTDALLLRRLPGG